MEGKSPSLGSTWVVYQEQNGVFGLLVGLVGVFVVLVVVEVKEFVVVWVGLVELGQEVLKVWMSTYCKGVMEKKVSGVVQLFGELHSQRE